MNRTRASKFLSLVLRHDPARIGLTLDAQGWADVDDLLQKANAASVPLTREELHEIVRTSDKQRFAISTDEIHSGTHIRANQGHSIPVDLALEPVAPPDVLYHGTVARFLPSICREGLHRGQRHHVHLSADRETASRVGKRRGEPVVLTVAAGRMQTDGYVFYCSNNGVWLVDHVPSIYVSEKD